MESLRTRCQHRNQGSTARVLSRRRSSWLLGVSLTSRFIILFTLTMPLSHRSIVIYAKDEMGQTSDFPDNSVTETYSKRISICSMDQCFDCSKSVEVSKLSACQCEDQCDLYDNCCWTSPISSCDENHDRLTPIYEGEICTGTRIKNGLTFGYFMKGKCPSFEQNRTLHKLCSDPRDVISRPLITWPEYAHHVPLLDTAKGKTYRNIFCAMCNNVKYADMSFWQLKTNCDSGEMSPQQCDRIEFEFQDTEYLMRKSPLRNCIVVDKENCSQSGKEQKSITCKSYLAVFHNEGVVYRNPQCALCSTRLTFPLNFSFCSPRDIVPYDKVPIKDKFYELPYMILFDFSTLYPSDGREESIPAQTCANGLVLTEGNATCELSTEATKLSWDTCIVQENPIVLNITIDCSSGCLLNLSETLTSIIMLYFGQKKTTITQGKCSIPVDENSCFHFNIYESHRHLQYVKNGIVKVIQNLLQKINGDLIITQVKFRTACWPSSEDKRELTLYGIYNYTDVIVYKYGMVHYVIIQSENRVYSQVVVNLEINLASTNIEDMETNIYIYLTDQSTEELNCPHELLRPQEYSIHQNKSLVSPKLKSAFPQSEYVILADNQSHVCIKNVKEIVTSPLTTVLLVISTIFTILSLIGLITTFITYVIFKPLRNLPGLVTMNFITAMFFAQLVLLLTKAFPESSTICIIIGMLGHFFWLSAFVWMSVVAYDVRRTFGTSLPGSSELHGRRMLLLYVAIGWISPFVVVAICVFMQTYTTLPDRFSYGGSDWSVCWLRPGIANVILFGIPAFLCLCFNFMMFYVTVRGIHEVNKSTKMARSGVSSSTGRRDARLHVLSVKISILIGLCWIWPFLYVFFPQATIFLVLHNILNSLHGVFIFWVYVCNTRVSAMWKGLLRGRGEKYGNHIETKNKVKSPSSKSGCLSETKLSSL
ncbi:G-protein coupled receptor Mth [Holothuria leucospilota]|uniref:G-protein coupled receptor Mth n=1 Tax=Holothuria leucospilota TaxID=206669 RepID=A0A9Q0YGI6_HOLLE|nr:G-protein coupled receptor Mth [Holothuria leucospilota]